jgi:hypothetical protein
METVEGEMPLPALRLFGDTVFDAFYGRVEVFATDQRVRLARVECHYPCAPEKYFPAGHGKSVVGVRQDDRVITLTRDLNAEKALADLLFGVGGLRRLNDTITYGCKKELQDAWCQAPDSPTRWFVFLTQEVPRLQSKGWIILTDESFQLPLLNPSAWYESVEPAEKPDWFTVDCGIVVDGQRIRLLPAILAFLRSESGHGLLPELEKMGEEPVMLPVESKFLPFPASRLHRILSALTELFGHGQQVLNGDVLEVHRLRAAQLAALDEASQQSGAALFRDTSNTLRQLGQNVRSAANFQAPLPAGLKAALRPYQAEGFRWLRFLATARLGGILADDMGLGKTLQTLAALLSEKESGAMDRPSLIVAPKSVVFNWAEEAARFTPALRATIYTGQDRSKLLTDFDKTDLILTSYPILTRDEEILAPMLFHWVILDEAQNIKNSQTKTAAAAYRLQARQRLCLTGTPMENHLGELWSIFHFLMPGFLGHRDLFRTAFREPIEKSSDDTRRKALAQRIAPVLLRRTKEAVLQDLPPKIEMIHHVELSGPQKDLYETVRAAMDERVREEIARLGAQRSQIMILDALLKLRQVCCDPRLLKLAAARKVTESAKLDALMEILPELIAEGRRVLLFSQFTEMLALIRKELTARRISHLILTGETENRGELVKKFQTGKASVFLISLKAGGVGLNLTAADTVIHYDPWWNPAAENQATDRAHRIGQNKTVFVYKFICQDTIEERILLLQQKKAELVRGLLEGGGERLRISEEDLAYLLKPIK